MCESPSGSEIVLTTRRRAECMEFHLVLEATGISAEVVSRDGFWLLVVNRDDLAISAAELDAYRHENPVVGSTGDSITDPAYAGAAAGVFVYAGTIIWIGMLAGQSAYRLDWLQAGSMQAGRVMGGEVWRTVTALTLHLDALHITANLAFGSVFGFLAGRVLGGGVAWLAIVIAGALGNFINALVQAASHSSVGASTAVFAALGVIVSSAICARASLQEKPLKRWSPLVGGVLLLAFIGVGGERTDFVAHLTGFLAGLLVGWLGCRLPTHWLASRSVQCTMGFATIALVTSAWIVALTLAG